MSKLSLREIAQSQLDLTPVIDGQLIVCLDTGNAYRDTATAHVKIGSDLEVVSDLPLAPLAEKLYYLKPDKLYVFLGGNWTLLNDKTIDLDEAIAKLPAESSTTLNDDVEIITQDTDITQPHYYRRKLVVLWEYIKTKAEDFFAAKNHKHGKADITDFPTSMPASDVYPWAKATTKPSYTKAEVGLGKVDNTADADKTVKRATTAGTADSANSVAWGNVKDKPTTFPPEAHDHDDRYYTEAEIDGKLEKKSPTDHTHDLSELISALSVGNSTTLNDTVQIITQGTDTDNQKYYRRPLSVLWNYIKSKADSVYSAIGHNHKIQNLEEYTTRVYDATIVRPADTVLASPQDKDGIATFRKLDKNDVGLENVDNTADVNKNVATAKNISINNPILAVGIENSEITGKTNSNKGYTNCTDFVWSIRNALDFRWYETHWQIGNIRGSSSNSVGFGFAYSADGKSYALKARIDNDGKYIGNLSGTADTSKSLKLLSSTRQTSMNFNLADSDYLGKITYQIASSSTTTGKPPRDCGVLNISWDNSGWGAQVAVEANNNPRMYIRGAISSNGASSWDSTWKTVEYKENLGTAAYKNVKNLSAVGTAGWTNQSTGDSLVPTMSFMAYWNGAYSGTASNLQYCDRGRFGTIVTKSSGDYATAGHIHLNGTKTGAIDWNTFTTYGVYKIQNCTMDNARHAPPDEYAFGILQVLDSENNGGEKRIIQIYWPHITTKGNHLWYRMHNSSDIHAGWSGWTQIKKKPDTAGYADSAATSNGVKDYNDGNRTIKIGYAGEGLNTSNLTHIAGYTDNGTKIKDVNKDVLKSWIGLGNYLPLGGGTITGQIKRGVGSSWINDRDNAIVYGTSSGTESGYHPVVGQKTPSGAWTIGTYGDERLIFDYTKDTDKKAGTNNGTQVYLPAQAGTIITSSTIGSQSVNYAKSAGSVAWGNVSGKPSTFTPSSHTHSSINSVGTKNAQTGRNQAYGNVYSYNSNASAHTGMPTTYASTIGFGQGAAGTVEICGEWTGGRGLWARALRDCIDNWYNWQRIYTENYHPSADTADNGVTASGKTGAGIYYVRFGNGTQMCWGFYKESDHSGSTSFPVAFNNSQYSLSLTITVSSNNAPYITGRSTTGFSYARHGTSYNDVQWIAVGTWK